LSAITLTVHASLITICQPYIRKSKGKPLTTSGSREQENYMEDVNG